MSPLCLRVNNPLFWVHDDSIFQRKWHHTTTSLWSCPVGYCCASSMTRTTMNPPPVQRFSRPHPPAVTQQRPLEADDRIELQQRIERAVFCVLGGLYHRNTGGVGRCGAIGVTWLWCRVRSLQVRLTRDSRYVLRSILRTSLCLPNCGHEVKVTVAVWGKLYIASLVCD